MHDAVCRLALVASHTFELFCRYSVCSNDSSVARNELVVAALQINMRCDQLLSDARVTLLPEFRQNLLEISEKLEYFAYLFANYLTETSSPQDLFIELRTRVGNVQYFIIACSNVFVDQQYRA